MNSKVCLITGGAGFIGCAISKGLADSCKRVIALDNLHPQIHPNRVRPQALDSRVELNVGDAGSPEVWDDLLRNVTPDIIVHLAAETGTGQSLTAATRHAQTNVCATAVMLDALARHSCFPRIVLSSSRAIYGEGKWRKSEGDTFYPGQRSRDQLQRQQWDFPGAQSEAVQAGTTEPRPVSVYGATKLAQEHVLQAWVQSLGGELAILRFQNVYGPGQSLTNPYTGIVPLFCQLAREGKSIPLYEDGQMLRDFVFIRDVADAIHAVIHSDAVPARPLDIGTGKATTIAALAHEIAEIYGAPKTHVTGHFRYGDVRHAHCLIDDSEQLLRWTPRYTLQAGLRELATWLDAELDRKIHGNASS